MAIAYVSESTVSFDAAAVTTATLDMASSGDNRLAFIIVNTDGATPVTVTVEGSAATLINEGGGFYHFFYFLSPPTAATTSYVCQLATAKTGVMEVIQLTGVRQSGTPYRGLIYASGTTTAPTITVSCEVNDMVIDNPNIRTNEDLVPGAGQTQIDDAWYANTGARFAYSYELATSTAVVMDWTIATSQVWENQGLAFIPVFLSTPSGAQTFTGTLVKDSRKVVSGAQTFTGIITKLINKTSGFSGAITFVGGLTKQVQKVVAGVLTFIGVNARVRNLDDVPSIYLDVSISADNVALIRPRSIFDGVTEADTISYLVFDTFYGNSASMASRVPSFLTPSGVTWQILSGTWSVTSGYAAHTGDATQAAVVVNSGQSDVIIEAEIENLTGTPDGGIILRATDDNNYLLVAIDVSPTNEMTFWRREGGTFTQIASVSTTYTENSIVKVTANGSTISGYVNGILVASVTSTFNSTATRHGLRDNGPTDRIRYDSFTVRTYAGG